MSELKIKLERVSNNEIYGIMSCGFNENILKKDLKDFIDGNSLIYSTGIWYFYALQKWAEIYNFSK
jgi:hypothetical protein